MTDPRFATPAAPPNPFTPGAMWYGYMPSTAGVPAGWVAYVQSDGSVAWKPPPVTLLAAAYANPAGLVTVNTVGSAFNTVDTTNLRAKFTAPFSGTVYVKYGGYMIASGGGLPTIGFMEGASAVGITLGALNGVNYLTGSWQVTGLTFGTAHSYDLAEQNGSGAGAVAIQYGAGIGGNGPAFIEVWG